MDECILHLAEKEQGWWMIFVGWCLEFDSVIWLLVGRQEGQPPSKTSSSYRRRFCCGTDGGRESTSHSRFTWKVSWLGGSALVSINEVTLRQARLVPGWVTVSGRVHHLSLWPATQANSAFCPQRDRKWVPAKVQWCCAAGD